MTLYEVIKNYSVEDMAAFIYGLIDETEQKALRTLEANGIVASIVSLAPELRIADNVEMLLQEVPDDT